MAKYCTKVEDWFTPKPKGFRLQCCSCGLVHAIDFRIVAGKVQMRLKRHERATSASRRAKVKKLVVDD